MAQDSHFDAIFVGTGFASSFYLQEYIKLLPPSGRILVLERGDWLKRADGSDEWPVTSTIRVGKAIKKQGWQDKIWPHTISFGGSSNCWWACTPRFMPNDFKLKSIYNVGFDWPIDYATLEPFYAEAEEVMSISGPSDTPYPRSTPYPQPPHRLTDPDRLLKKLFSDQFIPMPTARARLATGTRNACCGNAVCGQCPVNAKFTVRNGFRALYNDKRIQLELLAEVISVDIAAGLARGVVYRQNGEEKTATADLVVLGANAIYNPFILLKSGMDHPLLGKRLHEQTSVYAYVYFNGVENFQGSTSITGHGYMLYDGPHRANHSACLMETYNRPKFRFDKNQWRQYAEWRFIVENIPEDRSKIALDSQDLSKPLVIYEGHSQYALKGIDAAKEAFPKLFGTLPIERVEWGNVSITESHNQGTVVMGSDPGESVVDRKLLCHDVRNLAVLGASAFPSCSPANPTLTLSALSLYAARQL